MKLASFTARKVTAIIGTGILGAGLLGGMAFAATPSPSDRTLTTTPSGNVFQSVPPAVRYLGRTTPGWSPTLRSAKNA